MALPPQWACLQQSPISLKLPPRQHRRLESQISSKPHRPFNSRPGAVLHCRSEDVGGYPSLVDAKPATDALPMCRWLLVDEVRVGPCADDSACPTRLAGSGE